MGKECGDGAIGQECGDGRVRMSVETGNSFLLGIYFQNSPTIFLSRDVFQNYCFILLFNFLSCLRNVGESNDFALVIYFNFLYNSNIFMNWHESVGKVHLFVFFCLWTYYFGRARASGQEQFFFIVERQLWLRLSGDDR